MMPAETRHQTAGNSAAGTNSTAPNGAASASSSSSSTKVKGVVSSKAKRPQRSKNQPQPQPYPLVPHVLTDTQTAESASATEEEVAMEVPEEEQQQLLSSGRTTTPSTSATTPPLSDVAKALIGARQHLRKLWSKQARVHSHLSFCEACLSRDITARGLQVQTKCNALLADYTNVKERFAIAGRTAEISFKDSLVYHYSTASKKLHLEVLDVERSIVSLLVRATPEEREEHDKVIQASKESVDREKARLTESKNKKLTFLSLSPNRGRGAGRARGRGRRGPPQSRGAAVTDHYSDEKLDHLLDALMGRMEQRQGRGQPQPSAPVRQTAAGHQPQVSEAAGRAPTQNTVF